MLELHEVKCDGKISAVVKNGHGLWPLVSPKSLSKGTIERIGVRILHDIGSSKALTIEMKRMSRIDHT